MCGYKEECNNEIDNIGTKVEEGVIAVSIIGGALCGTAISVGVGDNIGDAVLGGFSGSFVGSVFSKLSSKPIGNYVKKKVFAHRQNECAKEETV